LFLKFTSFSLRRSISPIFVALGSCAKKPLL
jgi:hypothetical protein